MTADLVRKDRVFPIYQIATAGEDIEFVCLSFWEVFWLFNGKVISDNVETKKRPGSSSNILKIVNVNKEHSGVYSCYGIDNSFNYSFFEDHGILVVTRE